MKFIAIVKKDLIQEFRDKQTINTMFIFSFLTVVIFSYTLFEISFVPHLLWIIILFVSLLGLSRAFFKEKEIGTLEGLLASPINPLSILVAKILYNFILITIVELSLFALFFIFFEVNFGTYGFLFTLYATFGFVVVISVFSTFLLNAKARSMMLPVISMPIIFPLLLASVSGLKKILEGDLNILSEFKLITSYIGVVVVISLLTFEYIIEE